MAPSVYELLSRTAVIVGLMRTSAAFSFTYGAASQCDELQVSWTGGTAPFQLLITPNYGVPLNYSIPSGAYSNGQGSFSTPLPLNVTQSFLLTMSDATGFNTGGTTNLITVGESKGGSCNNIPPHIEYKYRLDSALVQCREFTIANYSGATQPVTLYGFIPGGDVFVVRPPTGPTLYDWTANITAGTKVIFSMFDAKGRTGGSAELRTVGQSDATDCLGAVSPATTSNAPSGTATSASATGSSTSSPTPGNSPEGKPDTGVIIGAIVGILIAIACIGTLALFFWRRRRASQNWAPNGSRHSRTGTVDLLHHGAGGSTPALAPRYSQSSLHRTMSPFDDPPHHLPPGHEPDPFMLAAPSTPAHAPYGDSDLSPTSDGPNAPFSPAHRTRLSSSTSMQSSAARRKAAMAGHPNYQAPSRFILHTDIEEAQPNEEGFIELPPQYSESRRPIVATTTSTSLHSRTEDTPVTPPMSSDPFLTPDPSRHPSDESRLHHPLP